MVNFFLAFVSQASMVLFPALRQSGDAEQRRVFSAMRDALTIVLPGFYVLCFPMIWLIGKWLPQYGDSLHFFVYLLPMCVFDGKMNLLGTTFFKVLREEKTLLRVNIATAAISAVGTLLGVYVLGSVDVVICSVVVALAFRSLASEEIISKKIGEGRSMLPVGEVLVSLGFLITGILIPGISATLCYLAMYVLFLFVFKSETRSVAASFRKLKGGLN